MIWPSSESICSGVPAISRRSAARTSIRPLTAASDALEVAGRRHDLHLALAGQFGNGAHRGLGRNVEDAVLRAGRRGGRERDDGGPAGEDGITRTHWLVAPNRRVGRDVRG
jgi:hypothetical protein